MKPVPSCAAGSDAVAGQTRQALTEGNRSKARRSAAMLGLAISMGASNLLVPQQGEAAVSKHLPATDRGNGMSASPLDPKLDRNAVASPLDESEISQTEEMVSPVEQARQRIDRVSEIDVQNDDLKVESIGAIEHLNNPPTLTENSSPMASAAPRETDGKPEPSFLVNSVSSQLPEFLFSASSTNPASLQDSSLDRDRWQNQELGMAGIEGKIAAPAEPLHKTITPGSAVYSATQSDSIAADREMLTDSPRDPLAVSQQNPVAAEARSTSEWDYPQINIEYTNPIPVPELLSEEEAPDPVTLTEELASEAAELQSMLETPESAAQEVAPELESAESSIEAIKPVEFQFGSTPLPIESHPESEVVGSPDLTNAVAIESHPESEVVGSPDLTNAVVIESAAAVAPASRIYRVGSGETLDTIAQKNNVSLSDLIAANQISDPNFIKAQEKIKIPLIDRENSTSLNADRDRGFSSPEADAVVLGTDAIYPLAPTRRPKANSESVAPTASTLSVDDRQNMGRVTNDDRTKTPYVNSLKADLDKLRQQYPVANPETNSQSQPQLPIDSPGQPSQPVVVTVPDLPVAEPRLNRVATEIAQASQDVASQEPEETPEAPANGYVQDLISDIERLRQNRAAQESARVQLSANDSSSSGSAPEASSQETPELWQAAIEDQPEEKRQGPASRSWQNPKIPREAESTNQDLLATGSQGTSAYQPLLQPTTGQMVTPQLPPLNGPETYLPDSPAIFNGYIWPANGVLSSGYGWRWGRMHNGIDIAGPVGTPIFAAAAGVVTYAGWNSGGYGNLVEIEHPDGSFTLYAHNNRILVREGQEVNQGEQVAEMGSTGFSTGPHLHFEIHPSGQGAVNPMAYLPSE